MLAQPGYQVLQILHFTAAVDVRMTGNNLFDQRGTRPGHADNEHRHGTRIRQAR